MKADALPITKLYDTLNKAYVIPNYQRPFAWAKGKAITLLDAVFEDARAGASLTSLGTVLFCEIPGTNANHPFGNNKAGATVAPNTIWEVVDGQQRMTVFALIGYALLRQLEHLVKTSGLAYSPPLEFEMFFATSRTKKGQSVPVLIRDGDNFDTGYCSELAVLLNAFPTNGSWPPPGVGRRLMEAQEAVLEWVRENLKTNDDFVAFSDHFLTKCTIVQVQADDQDTAFAMFEPLNSTSEPLTAFEVFRSKAVRKFNAQFPRTLDLLAYETSSRDEVVKKSNDLIFSMAQAFSGERPRIHFVPLKHYLDGQVAAPFVAEFEAAADFHRSVWLQQICADAWFDDEAKNCVRFLKAMQHDVAVPLLLRYYLSDRAALPDVLRTVVAFFALWRAAYPTNTLPNVYRALLTRGGVDDMSVEGGNPLRSIVALRVYFRQKLLARIGTPQAGQSVSDKWRSETVYLNYEALKTLCRLYIFADIGLSIKANLVPDDPWTSADDVEHIHAVAVLPAPLGLNQIGNLTFLPSVVNKSLQNAVWEEKKEVYELLASSSKVAATSYASGKALPPAVQAFLKDAASPALAHLGPVAAHSTWGDAEINARTDSVLNNAWNLFFDSWLN